MASDSDPNELFPLEIDLQSCQIWLNLQPKLLARFVAMPEVLLTRIYSAANQMLDELGLKYLSIYDERLKVVWDRLSTTSEPVPIRLLVAAGAPALKGVSVTLGDGQRDAAYLRLPKQPLGYSNMRPEWLRVFVEDLLRRQGVAHRVSYADIQGAWLCGLQGLGEEREFNIGLVGENPGLKTSPFTIKIRPRHQRADLVINNADRNDLMASYRRVKSATHDALASLAWHLPVATHRSGEKGADPSSVLCFWRFLVKGVASALEDAAYGPMALNIERPASIVAMMALAYHRPESAWLDLLVHEMLTLRASGATFEELKELIPPRYEPGALQESLDELTRVGIISMQKSKSYLKKREIWTIGVRLLSSDDRSYFEAGVAIAVDALERVSDAERTLQAMTVVMDQEVEKLATAAIKELCGWISAHCLATPEKMRDEVYSFGIQMFPLSRMAPEAQTSGPMVDRASWLKLVVREMVGLDLPGANGKHTAAAMSRYLYPRISADRIQETLADLERAQLIAFDANSGRYRQTTANLVIDHGSSGQNVLNFYQDILELSRTSLDCVPAARRLLAGGTMSAAKSGMSTINSKIIDTLEQIFAASSAVKSRHQLYQINMQLIPLTTRTPRDCATP